MELVVARLTLLGWESAVERRDGRVADGARLDTLEVKGDVALEEKESVGDGSRLGGDRTVSTMQ
jgi:hypothetical protein